jgi:hypothetical protein
MLVCVQFIAPAALIDSGATNFAPQLLVSPATLSKVGGLKAPATHNLVNMRYHIYYIYYYALLYIIIYL